MGTCILMGNLSAFKTDLRDEWTLQETTSPSTGTLFSRPVLCLVFSQTDSANDLLPRSSDNFDYFEKLQLFFLQILPCNQLCMTNCIVGTSQMNHHVVGICSNKDVNRLAGRLPVVCVFLEIRARVRGKTL